MAHTQRIERCPADLESVWPPWPGVLVIGVASGIRAHVLRITTASPRLLDDGHSCAEPVGSTLKLAEDTGYDPVLYGSKPHVLPVTPILNGPLALMDCCRCRKITSALPLKRSARRSNRQLEILRAKFKSDISSYSMTLQRQQTIWTSNTAGYRLCY